MFGDDIAILFKGAKSLYFSMVRGNTYAIIKCQYD